MFGRTLGSAALAMAVCFSIPAPVQAQNLEAGKSPAQIFNGACAVCHKSPRGLVKSVPPSSLPTFLRQHYTTSSDMAGALSGYLLANGAVDRRPNAEKPRRGRDAAPAVAAPAAAPAPSQNGWWPFQRQPAAQTAVPDSAGEAGHPPSRKQRKHKTKKSKAAPQQPPHSAAGSEGAKPDSAKPESASSPAPKPDSANSAPAQRPDPVPAVTPAAEPKASEPKASESKASEPKAAEPKASEPKASEPKASEPKASEPRPSDSKAD